MQPPLIQGLPWGYVEEFFFMDSSQCLRGSCLMVVTLWKSLALISRVCAGNASKILCTCLGDLCHISLQLNKILRMC